MAIKCYHCKGNHELVIEVKACAGKPVKLNVTAGPAKGAEAVTAFLNNTDNSWADKVKKVAVPAHRTSAKYLALKAQIAPAPVIAKTIDQQVAEHDAVLAVIKKGQDLECGMYQVGDIIFKVKWNKTNTYKYAERLFISTTAKYDTAKGAWIDMPKGKFFYANSMMKTLTSEHKMTEEMAKAFHDATKAKYGVDYGFCCVCGKLLTVKKSIADGYGPVCAKYFA